MSRLTDPFQGTITGKSPMQGVIPGAGMARGGQQGRMDSMTGGIGGVKHPIANAKGSQPAAPTPSSPAAPTPAAPVPTQQPQSVPQPSAPAPDGLQWRPVYGWWRVNPSAPWSRYVRAWQAAPKQGTM